LPNAFHDWARWHMRSNARSAIPIARMQWWMRPGIRCTVDGSEEVPDLPWPRQSAITSSPSTFEVSLPQVLDLPPERDPWRRCQQRFDKDLSPASSESAQSAPDGTWSAIALM
jgi:hypothetical protein